MGSRCASSASSRARCLRTGQIPADGPPQWSAGTLFPLSSKKVARAINAATGNRPVVVLANLSGFDGSPESLRRLQLEYGAEIGRAIVNFDGPIVLCVVSRYHGGAFVVFSGRLNDRMQVLAVEGAHASVIGGAPAAAVVFTREVNARTQADDRVRALEAGIADARASRTGPPAGRARHRPLGGPQRDAGRRRGRVRRRSTRVAAGQGRRVGARDRVGATAAAQRSSPRWSAVSETADPRVAAVRRILIAVLAVAHRRGRLLGRRRRCAGRRPARPTSEAGRRFCDVYLDYLSDSTAANLTAVDASTDDPAVSEYAADHRGRTGGRPAPRRDPRPR